MIVYLCHGIDMIVYLCHGIDMIVYLCHGIDMIVYLCFFCFYVSVCVRACMIKTKGICVVCVCVCI
jgi:hypothetical protein